VQWYGKRGIIWFGCALITKRELFPEALQHNGRYVYFVDIIVDKTGIQNSVAALACLEAAFLRFR